MSDEELAALVERVKVLEDRLADVDALLAATLSGEEVDEDPLLAAFGRHKKRASRA